MLRSNAGPDHILVITNRFTKFIRAILQKSTASQAATDALFTYRAYAYGLPDRVLSDYEPQLTACYFQHTMASLITKHVPTSTYHPQTNGYTEGAIVHYSSGCATT